MYFIDALAIAREVASNNVLDDFHASLNQTMYAMWTSASHHHTIPLSPAIDVDNDNNGISVKAAVCTIVCSIIMVPIADCMKVNSQLSLTQSQALFLMRKYNYD